MGTAASVQNQLQSDGSTTAAPSSGILHQLTGAARERAVKLSQRFGGEGALPHPSALSVHAAIELTSRLAKFTHRLVLDIYNDTFVSNDGATGTMMSNGCLASQYALDVIDYHHQKDPANAAVSLTMAEVQLRFGQMLGVMAQTNAWFPQVGVYFIYEPLGLAKVGPAFLRGESLLKEAQKLFAEHQATAPPSAIGACQAALGELYYCACSASQRLRDITLSGMDGPKMLLESLRLLQEAVTLRESDGLGITDITSNFHKDLGKVFCNLEEAMVHGMLTEPTPYGSPDNVHALGEKHLKRSAKINQLLGASASTDANLLRLLKSAGMKPHETAENRALRVASRLDSITKEHKVAASITELLQSVGDLSKIVEHISSSLNPHRLGVLSTDLLAFGYHTDQKAVEEKIVQIANEVLAPPINKASWKMFKQGLLKSNIWFRPSSKASDGGMLLYRTLLAGAAAKVQELESGLTETLKPFAEGIAKLSDPATYPCVDRILRQDQLEGNASDFSKAQLPNQNSRTFYDLKVFLPKMTMVARIINPDFQQWVKHHFSEFGEVCPGPIKTLERAEAKAENDYGNKEWPTSAHVIDLVRTRLLVETPDLVAAALQKARQLADAAPSADGLQALARVKNSFVLEDGGFRDIKVSVAFQSEGVSMVCELAINLRAIHEFGRKVHILYEIMREQQFYEEVEKKLLGQPATAEAD